MDGQHFLGLLSIISKKLYKYLLSKIKTLTSTLRLYKSKLHFNFSQKMEINNKQLNFLSTKEQNFKVKEQLVDIQRFIQQVCEVRANYQKFSNRRVKKDLLQKLLQIKSQLCIWQANNVYMKVSYPFYIMISLVINQIHWVIVHSIAAVKALMKIFQLSFLTIVTYQKTLKALYGFSPLAYVVSSN